MPDKIVACLDCNYNKARNMAEGLGNSTSGVFVSKSIGIFDPITENVYTFYYNRSYEPEIGNLVQLDIMSNDSDFELAVRTYNAMLDIIDEQIEDTSKIKVFTNRSSASPVLSVSDRAWVYDIVQGSTPVLTEFPSYSWMQNNIHNEIDVKKYLSKKYVGTLGANLVSNAAKRAFLKIITTLPLQYSVVFKNGDSVTFIVNGFSSDMFLELRETASNSNGVKYNGNSNTVGAPGSDAATYLGLFYDEIESGTIRSQYVCVIVRTGVHGSQLRDQKVCFYLYY